MSAVAIICCFTTFMVVAAVSGANVRRAVISKDLTVRNVSTLETINDVIEDLIEQMALIKTTVVTSSAGDEENNRTPGPAPLQIQEEEEEGEEAAVDKRGVSQNQKRILGLWTRPKVTPTMKGWIADLMSNKHVESGKGYSSSSTKTKSNNDRRNDSALSAGGVNSHYTPNFHLTIKIGRDDSYISENLALLRHLNQSIERLREFNDKYERLIANDEAINRNVGKLNNNSVADEDANAPTKNGGNWLSIRAIGPSVQPLQPSADSLVVQLFTATASALNSRTSETNPRVNNNDIIDEIRANLMA